MINVMIKLISACAKIKVHIHKNNIFGFIISLYIKRFQSRSSFLVATTPCRCPRMCVLNYEIVISVQTINKYQHDL